MVMLLLGLVLFLGVHSTRIVADGWRTAMIARIGEMPWKAAYAVLSIVGFVLIVWGFGLARQQPVQLWMPPRGMRHLASLLTLIAFVLLAATYVPRNAIKARLHSQQRQQQQTQQTRQAIQAGHGAPVQAGVSTRGKAHCWRAGRHCQRSALDAPERMELMAPGLQQAPACVRSAITSIAAHPYTAWAWGRFKDQSISRWAARQSTRRAPRRQTPPRPPPPPPP